MMTFNQRRFQVVSFTTTESDQYDSMIRMTMGSLGKGKRILELLRRQTNLLSVALDLKYFSIQK
ncbi:MAG: hypothetical protein CM15mV18_0740 [uncultured marine virus]|nr:MAG: hypothetical protein CM15mV18_0740 [uncultured marine virus]